MKYTIITLVALFVFSACKTKQPVSSKKVVVAEAIQKLEGVPEENYDLLVVKADSLYDVKQYELSAKTYKMAFDQIDGKAYSNHRYNAACSYALSKNKERAFYHLTYLADNPQIKYMNLGHITTDPDLNYLHEDERWAKLIETVTANKNEYEKDFDKPLVAILDSIYQSDQGYRMQLREVEEKHGRESNEVKKLWGQIAEADSINLIKVKKILNERGWLGPDVIGRQGNSTLFLVVQHSDLETQLKYLPMMREAVKLGNARGRSLALLEDRVLLGQGKRQIYGSQLGRDKETGEFYVSPMIEPEKVNERRADVGLGPIEEYTMRFGMTWDLEKHKAHTKKVEAEEKD